MKTPPTIFPNTMASRPQSRSRWNTWTTMAPVTIGSGAILVLNQRVNRSRALPWRSAGGT
ncbi:hypothetical protein D3C72_2378210 [compost metagenome]